MGLRDFTNSGSQEQCVAGTVAKERRILLCIDEFPNSRRAVQYVGRLLGTSEHFMVTILNIVEESDPDQFQDQHAARQYIQEQKEKAQKVLSEARDLLITMGVPESAIVVELDQRRCESLSQCIMEKQRKYEFGTIVLGRRGISKDEEFLFGSVCTKVIRYARECTIWVVE